MCRVVRCYPIERDGLVRMTTRVGVAGDDIGVGAQPIRELPTDHREDARVKFPAGGTQHRLIGGVVNEGVLEAVRRGTLARRRGQTRRLERRDSLDDSSVGILRRLPGVGDHEADKIDREVAPNDCRDLGDGLALAEPIETGEQQAVEAERDVGSVSGDEVSGVALERGLHQLLEEQWVALGTLDDPADGRSKHVVVDESSRTSCDAGSEIGRRLRGNRLDRDARRRCQIGPQRGPTHSCRHQQQHPGPTDRSSGLSKEFEARRIRPMHVLDTQHNRLSFAETDQPGDEAVHGQAAIGLGAEMVEYPLRRMLDVEQRCQQCDWPVDAEPGGLEQTLDPTDPLARVVIGSQPGSALDDLDDRVERRVLTLAHTVTLEPMVLDAVEMLAQ